MDDKYALGEESEAVHLQTEAANDGEQGGESADNAVSRLNEQTRCGGLVKTKHVRAILFAGELLMCFGAGMTVKFFPVFFDKECHIKPIAVQAMFAALSGCTVLGTLLANKAAWRFGRMEVIVPAYSVGIACTVLLGLMKPWYAIPWVMLPIFMLRCTAMWSNSALLGSVIADYTPKASRGRCKALGSIISAGWSGSAAIGGFLIDHYGYGSTFVVTGCFQAFCIPLWLLVFPLIAKETDLLDAAAGSSAPAPTSAQGTPTTGKSPATTRNTPKRSAAVCQALASASPKLNSLYGSSQDASSKRPSEQKGSAVAPGP
jgi:MFS family permease